MLSLIAWTLLMPIAASEPDASELIEGAGTVIIGGDSCQMIALDDGRFFVLQEGALPNSPLQPLQRIRLTATPVAMSTCKHAQPVAVESLQFLPDLSDGPR